MNAQPAEREHPHRSLDSSRWIYFADLLRLFWLLRHGARVGALLRDQTSAELRCASSRFEHHRFLAALAYDIDALLDRVHLQPDGPLVNETQASKGLTRFWGAEHDDRFLVYLLMFPTLVTMLISGLWHGAGYGFIIWGFLHGCFLTVNHAWRLLASKLWSNKRAYDRIMTPVGFVLTFLVVCIAMVFFRATTIASASDLLRGLAGLNGVGLPNGIFGHLGGLGNTLQSAGVFALSWGVLDFTKALLWVAVPLFVALACPDTFEILAPYEPALGVTEQSVKNKLALAMKWNASIPWAVAMSAMAAMTIVSIGGPSEFLYWQF